MKKVIASALSAVVLTSAWAFDITPRHIDTTSDKFDFLKIEKTVKAEAAPSRAEEKSLDYTPAGEPYAAYGLNNAVARQEYAQAFEFTAENATTFAGNKITAINFYVGGNGQSGANQIKNYTVFITEDLEKDPIVSQEYITNATQPYTFCSAELKNPYTIEAGKALYIGIRYTTTSAYDYTFVADGLFHEDYVGGWYAVKEGSTMKWNNITEEIGFFCLGATITGETLPNNVMSVDDMACTPVVTVNQPFDFQVLVRNNGADDIKTIEIEYTIGNNAPVSEAFEFKQGCPYNGYGILTVPQNIYGTASGDDVVIKFTVTKVNGVENTDPRKSNTTSFIVLPEGKGYTKQVVIEEITGTWCGYCPAGIVTMEAIRENFPEGGLIPVAVHVRDDMSATSWQDVANLGGSSVPAAILNRQTDVYPGDYDGVIEAYQEVASIPALGKINVSFEPVDGTDSNVIRVKATTEFVFDIADASDRYILSFGITEDGLGPFKQTNYYAGGANGPCGGWEKLGSSVETVYNDVATLLVTYNGIKGSIPASVKAETPNVFERDITLSSKVNLDNINVVAYLIDLRTGVVENAATVKSKYYNGVADVEVDNNENAPVEYFNLQGVRVANPSTGIFIRRQGTSVSKVMVR